MNTEHTRIPWYVNNTHTNGPEIWWKQGEQTSQVCIMRWTDGLNAEVEQRVLNDAAFIVKACNSHAALLEAAEAAEQSLHGMILHHENLRQWKLVNPLIETRNKVQAAIAKAKAEQS